MLTIAGSSQAKQKTQTEKDYSVVLHNEVKSIELENDSSSSTVRFIITLSQEVVNDGEKPVIFLKDRLELRGISLGKSPNTFSLLSKLVLEYHGESVNTSLEWTKFRNNLDKPSPPTEIVRILMPNESIKSEGIISVTLPKETHKGNFSKGNFADERESWANIKQLSSVWLQTNCQVWSLNLETSAKNRDKLKFGKKLQRRWKKYGYLWLDDIVSEPIPLDLSSAVVKAKSN